MSKMQPTVTDYFKPKKRLREDQHKSVQKLSASVKLPKELLQSSKIIGPDKKSTPSTSTSTITPLEPQKFYSPVKNQNIFSSPVKLKDIKSPIKSPGRTAKRLFDDSDPSTETAPPRKIPAYLRFQHLTEKTPESRPTLPPQSPTKVGQHTEQPSSLTLPLKLRILKELFKAVESVTSILHNRKEIITFSKVKSSVVKLVRRVSLKEKHLAQFLTVYPECYKLTQEKIKASDCSKGTYELVISLHVCGDKMSATLTTERQRIFHQNLINICLRRHKEFLASLVPPVIVPDDKAVTRWHPKFNVDTIPDIARAIIPAPPTDLQPSTAREVINKAQHILDSANPRMKKALQDLLKKTPPEDSNKMSPSSVQPRLDNDIRKSIGALKGISQSLIEKIRAREQQKSIRALTITPQESKRKVILGRLPEFVKILRNLFVAEKKVAVSMDIAVERLSHSNHGSIPPGEIEEHIKMMASVLPDWIKILSLSQGKYVKIDKTIDINDLLESLKDINKN